MSRIIIVIQDKGGVRKSTTLIHLAHFLRTNGHTIQLVDLEHKDRLTMRYDKDCIPVSPDIEELRARNPASMKLPQLMRAGVNLLVDCGGGSFPYWDRLLQMDKPPLLEYLRAKGAKLTLLVPVGEDVDSQNDFAEYDSFFAAANPDKVLATFGGSSRGRADHPAEMTINLPLLPSVLAYEISKRGMPAGELAKLTTEDLGFPVGFARNADVAFTAEFSRLIKHFTP